MERIDYHGRSFTVSDRFTGALVSYLDEAVTVGEPLGEWVG